MRESVSRQLIELSISSAQNDKAKLLVRVFLDGNRADVRGKHNLPVLIHRHYCRSRSYTNLAATWKLY